MKEIICHISISTTAAICLAIPVRKKEDGFTENLYFATAVLAQHLWT